MRETTVLVVDRNGTEREATAETVRAELAGASVRTADSLAAAKEVLEAEPVDAVVTGYDLGDGTGLELAAHVRSVTPDAGCILYTRSTDVATDSFEDTVIEFVPKESLDAEDHLVALVEAAGPKRTQASYPLAPDEDDRLAAVEEYVDDADAVAAPVERITRLAADHFGVEVSSVSIVREHTQEFLACHGRDWEPVARDDSICTHTIVQDGGTMAVEDTREDPRFADNESLQDSGIIAYLGANVETPDGHAVGSLCVYDDEPRSFSEADRTFLATLAGLVGDVLALNRGREPA